MKGIKRKMKEAGSASHLDIKTPFRATEITTKFYLLSYQAHYYVMRSEIFPLIKK